ncbi:FimV family protein [Pseudomonas schmalbachii]|uniref:FimV family protein n=1 Tax=Pseudomonas schmalbachii TaxID=2816993 RepID=A0ABS3TLL1_9PSED|nr:FimV family protein [Pseudomonas schmalbachii]MBO3274551.1 FimV family protein [Pseudomonas schmalbachii]
MVRLRKLVQAIAAASALTTGMAHALGVGEIHLNSALNQPLDAEIDLLEVRDLSSGEVVPRLASPEDFSKAGVDRQYFLTGLRFTPVVKPNGRSVIRVTSDRPVQEPYLNFLVEVVWPSGRLLREYTVLLDPPLYSPQVTAAAVPRAPVAAPAPIPRPVAPAAPRPAPAPVAAAPALEGGQYRTGPRDTLWEIASRARPNGSVSVHQTMLAIQDLNPDAFLGGNINRLKSGQVLRLPDAEQVRARSQNEALAQVVEQNTAWRERRSLPAGGARQIDATQRASAGSAPAEAEVQDNLRLLSGEAGKAKGSEKGSQNSKAVADELAITQESLDTTRRENDELQGRMKDLQSQLDKLQKLIELKDAQLARLQADLSTQPAPATADAAPQTGQPAEPAPVAAAPAAAEGASPAASATEPAAAQAPEAAVEPKPAAAPETKPAPAAAPAPAEEPQVSLLDEILANPVWLGAIAGSTLLVLLVLLMVLSRRNAAKQQAAEGAQAADESLEPGLSDDLDLTGSGLEGWDVSEAKEKNAEAQSAVSAQASQPSGDALGEADIYIAYGRFNQAAEMLQSAIYDEPQRTDLRLKLMEVHAETGDREGFARQEKELREIGGAETEVEQLKSRYPGMVALAAVGGGLAAAAAATDELENFSLDDLELDEPVIPAPAAQPVVADAGLDDAFDLALDDLAFDEPEPEVQKEEEGDLSLEDFDLGAELGLVDSAPTAAPADDELAFDLDLQADSALEPIAKEPVDELADFSFDLENDPSLQSLGEDDFVLDLADESAPLAGVSAEEFSFDLESDAAAPQASELPDDFDLSLASDASLMAEGETPALQSDEAGAELDRLVESVGEPEDEVSPFVAEQASMSASSLDDGESDDEFDFLSGADEAATKLDLARAYIDMGDAEGARDILGEVISEGNDNQQQEARELLGRIA